MDGSFAIEEHPWQPFLPQGCRLLMLGSFPPARKRWCMDFFYPNYINDMWRIFGIVFFGDKQHFVDEERKQFRMDDIIRFLTERGIGLYDTAVAVRRLKNTASDKDLEVVTNRQLRLYRMPSSSRAYPMKVEKKAGIYQQMFNAIIK